MKKTIAVAVAAIVALAPSVRTVFHCEAERGLPDYIDITSTGRLFLEVLHMMLPVVVLLLVYVMVKYWRFVRMGGDHKKPTIGASILLTYLVAYMLLLVTRYFAPQCFFGI